MKNKDARERCAIVYLFLLFAVNVYGQEFKPDFITVTKAGNETNMDKADCSGRFVLNLSDTRIIINKKPYLWSLMAVDTLNSGVRIETYNTATGHYFFIQKLENVITKVEWLKGLKGERILFLSNLKGV